MGKENEGRNKRRETWGRVEGDEPQFVKTAKGFTSEIVIVKGDKEASAKSALKIMTLAARKGDEIVIRAEGEDAEEAVDALVDLISQDEH